MDLLQVQVRTNIPRSGGSAEVHRSLSEATAKVNSVYAMYAKELEDTASSSSSSSSSDVEDQTGPGSGEGRRERY